MRNPLKFNSIRARLVMAFSIMIVLVVLAGAVGVGGVTLLQDTIQENLEVGFVLNELTLQARSDMNVVQRQLTLYLSSYENLGLEAARDTYLPGLSESAYVDQVEQTLTEIGALGVVDQEGTPITAERAAQYAGAYQSGARRLVEQIEQRGLRAEGSMRDFQNAADFLKNRVMAEEDAMLQRLLVNMGETEKDYFYYGDDGAAALLEQLTSGLTQRMETINPAYYESAGIEGLVEEYLTTFQDVVDADGRIRGTVISIDAQVTRINDEFDHLETVATQMIDDAKSSLADQVALVQSLVGTAVVAAVVVGFLVAFRNTRMITRPLNQIVQATTHFAEGDSSARVQGKRSDDEIGHLAASFNQMAGVIQERQQAERLMRRQLEAAVADYVAFAGAVADGDLVARLQVSETEDSGELHLLSDNLNEMAESLSEMAQQVRDASASILSATAEIQATATQQSASATEQAAIVTQTVATVDEIRTTVLQTAERAQIVADMAQQTVDVSMAGERAVTDTMTGMELLRERVEGIAENILLLSERTQQIGEIIEVVNTIAEQSKLLALNASIEAARAGEEGKGFAVVAMEVRQLAEQSREATARVGSILTEIQQATNNAVMVTEEGSKGAESSMELVERAGEAIRELAASIAEAAQSATQIAASTHQQTNGMDQLAAAMGQIKQATSQTTTGMQQTEKSLRDLVSMAHQLEQATERYRLTGDSGHEPELDLVPNIEPEPDSETEIA